MEASAAFGFAEEEEAPSLDGVGAGAGEVGGGGDAAEEDEPVPEGAEDSFLVDVSLAYTKPDLAVLILELVRTAFGLRIVE